VSHCQILYVQNNAHTLFSKQRQTSYVQFFT
jgi:hypothetical protein